MKARPLAERFWEKVDKLPGEDACWLWTGAKLKTSHHYGKIAFGRFRWALAHRVSWFLAHGVWPADKTLHRCDNPICVRPSHLFEGTQKDNVLDAMSKGRLANQKKTHCYKGHEFTAENTYVNNGRRSCRICRRVIWRRYRDKHATANL